MTKFKRTFNTETSADAASKIADVVILLNDDFKELLKEHWRLRSFLVENQHFFTNTTFLIPIQRRLTNQT